ncbi:respiratory nitrate reductase subunit gamma [Streptomyces collinus]|uniref:respiratory nitrate reductase subunit gamma n=1 Tax=Streptomyces collinus TaxID=42684 RepID=UPI0037B291FE
MPFQLHAISALLLFAAWPFTRLVRMLTAPLGYLTRPYIVYRSREPDSAPVTRAVVGTAWGHEQPGSESRPW